MPPAGMGSPGLPPWQVSADGSGTHRNDYQPRLIVAGDGRPWLVWVGHDQGPDDEIFASYWTGRRLDGRADGQP